MQNFIRSLFHKKNLNHHHLSLRIIKKITKITVQTIILLTILSPLSAQTFSESFLPFKGTPRHYICYRAADSIVIDGKPDEASWNMVAWSEDFKDIEGDARPAPSLRTRLKMLWDDNYLYIAATMQEPHVWGTLQQHDAIIFHDNDFEVFIDPDGDTHQYFEIEINALNTVMDLFMQKPYRNGGTAMLNWDVKGLRTAVSVNGTINQASDKDSSWTVEMAIPFSALRFFNDPQHPADSAIWRINFSRVEWDTDIRNGRYVKQQRPEHNWVWSPQDIINMHAPERWGYLWFTTQTAGNGNVIFNVPATEDAKRYLWDIYHRQQQYKRAHGRFASTPKELGVTPEISAGNNKVYHLNIEGTSSQYEAIINGSTFKGSIHLNQEGRIYSERK
ncbi:MAG TPA: carbohydrate-binding family 9-like protein [Chitinophaga sp.]|uniref:carbohydrate-binding family 9-like protein n=1 Tax=Chitinophaga sp. TaxID=1869181 RepID=UPI002B6E575E|nr:carbohydrate-binding family 9-like protein [Chitinophaga sp.]HVI46729.1 carbohydrate-binding family 9-like protein [Chitinophaga sp.]